MSKRTVVLLILDGWGIGQRNITNPIYSANPPTIAYIKANYPAGALQASGIAVGLPWNEEGNSEVGHLTIGAGRVIYQHLPRITMAIHNGEFFKNNVLTEAMHHATHHKSTLHLIGLLSEGNVHASQEHLQALIKQATDLHVPKVNLHLFADGKDSPPKSFLALVNSLNTKPPVTLASVTGRYYAMDHNKHWERTVATYAMLTGNGPLVSDFVSYVEQYHVRGLNDEFIEPALLGSFKNRIAENDAIIFFNFREDGIRQIATPFCSPPEILIKENIPANLPQPPKNLYVATMTHYAKSFTCPVAFPPEKITQTLGEVIAHTEKSQLRIAETEKYAHITFFFNGFKEAPLKNEYRVLIPSRSAARPDDRPEMMTHEIINRVIQTVEEGITFVLANIASPDIIAHTGNFDAAIRAIQYIDKEIATLLKTILARNAILLITADHGNIEQMRNPKTGAPETKHNINPVPIYLIANELQRAKDSNIIAQSENEIIGTLADIAPTILQILEISKPLEMKGESLLERLF